MYAEQTHIVVLGEQQRRIWYRRTTTTDYREQLGNIPAREPVRQLCKERNRPVWRHRKERNQRTKAHLPTTTLHQLLNPRHCLCTHRQPGKHQQQICPLILSLHALQPLQDVALYVVIADNYPQPRTLICCCHLRHKDHTMNQIIPRNTPTYRCHIALTIGYKGSYPLYGNCLSLSRSQR